MGAAADQHLLGTPWSVQVDAAQQTPLLHAASPEQLTSHDETAALHVIGASQADPPSHRIEHELALHSSPPPQELAARHSIEQRAPAHLTLPPQLEGARHSTAHDVAPPQSTPPWQAESLLQRTRHPMPSGHFTVVVHRPGLVQSKTQVVPWQAPPRIVQRSSHGRPASTGVPPVPLEPPPPPVPAPPAPAPVVDPPVPCPPSPARTSLAASSTPAASRSPAEPPAASTNEGPPAPVIELPLVVGPPVVTGPLLPGGAPPPVAGAPPAPPAAPLGPASATEPNKSSNESLEQAMVDVAAIHAAIENRPAKAFLFSMRRELLQLRPRPKLSVRFV
jgi:hypothetical protein